MAFPTKRLEFVCGRFTLKTPLGKWLFELFGVDASDEFPACSPRFNIAPTQLILIGSLASAKGIALEWARWGLIPRWARDDARRPPLINARSETLLEKPIFRGPVRNGRCAVIADGYYEWQTIDKGRKQPYWIHRPNEMPFLMAAIAETDSRRGEKSVAIVTTSSYGQLASIHDRMPMILDDSEKTARWLSAEPIVADSIGAPLINESYFQARPVSNWVGNPRHEDSCCLDPIPLLWERTAGADEQAASDV